MRKPRIGVIPLWDKDKQSLWMLPGYLDGLLEAGALPLILPLTGDEAALANIAVSMDGFLFTGGHDVSPTLYGESPRPKCGELCEQRDHMEELLLLATMEMDKPALGICRGLQLFNAVMGGTLYQDIPSERASAVRHRQEPPYDQPTHEVSLVPASPLQHLLQADTLYVNSYHHQGVKQLSSALRAMAHAADGLVEALYHPKKRFIWAVQWHPEFAPDNPASQLLFSAFADACRVESKAKAARSV